MYETNSALTVTGMLRSLKKTAKITVKLPIGSLGTLLIKTSWANRYDFIIKTTVFIIYTHSFVPIKTLFLEKRYGPTINHQC